MVNILEYSLKKQHIFFTLEFDNYFVVLLATETVIENDTC